MSNKTLNINELPKNNYWDTRIKPRLEEVRKWCAEGLTEAQIATRLGMTPSIFSKYKLAVPILKDLVSRGKTEAIHNVENSLYKLCVGYRYKKTKYSDGPQGAKSEEIEEVVQPNVTAIQYFLNNRAPDRWRASAQQGSHTANTLNLNTQNNVIVKNPDGGMGGITKEELKNIIGNFDSEFMMVGDKPLKFEDEETLNIPAKRKPEYIEDVRGLIVEDDDFDIIGGLPEDEERGFTPLEPGAIEKLGDGEEWLGDTETFNMKDAPEFNTELGEMEMIGVKIPGVDDKGDFGDASADFRERAGNLDSNFEVREVTEKRGRGRPKKS